MIGDITFQKAELIGRKSVIKMNGKIGMRSCKRADMPLHKAQLTNRVHPIVTVNEEIRQTGS